MTERRVAVLLMMETFTSRDMYGSKYRQRHQDRQVHDREKGGRLVDDGDIHIDGRHRPTATRPDNSIETVRSMTERRVAVLSMMETSTLTGDKGTETWKQVQCEPSI
jgi:hypothetical protein